MVFASSKTLRQAHNNLLFLKSITLLTLVLIALNDFYLLCLQSSLRIIVRTFNESICPFGLFVTLSLMSTCIPLSKSSGFDPTWKFLSGVSIIMEWLTAIRTCRWSLCYAESYLLKTGMYLTVVIHGGQFAIGCLFCGSRNFKRMSRF
ncbi:hypothetical protein ACOME3_001975 [Neoechinorhynchus agilis]